MVGIFYLAGVVLDCLYQSFTCIVLIRPSPCAFVSKHFTFQFFLSDVEILRGLFFILQRQRAKVQENFIMLGLKIVKRLRQYRTH